MDTTTIEYRTIATNGLINHSWLGTMLLGDRADENRRHTSKPDLELAAQVKSGDYFITLATKLDAMSRDMVDYHLKSEIEDIVSDLIHLQDHYRIAVREK